MNVLLNFHKFPENFLVINNAWIPHPTLIIKEKKFNLNSLKTHAIITSSESFYIKPIKKPNTLHEFICVTLSN